MDFSESHPLDTEERKAPSPVLRPATNADIDFLRNTFAVAYEQVMLRQFGSWNEHDQQISFDRVIADEPIQIITVEGKPCGFLQIDELPNEIWIDEVVLLPEAQGKGIGSTLVRQVQETAQQRQLPVKLNVLHANPAIELYRRLGFQRIGDTETYTEMEWRPASSSAEF
jgi:ribosomal protein S18 acetylase RimI-like enzyme